MILTTLALEVAYYIGELQEIVNECEKPSDGDQKCLQCHEKRRIISRLKGILDSTGESQ